MSTKNGRLRRDRTSGRESSRPGTRPTAETVAFGLRFTFTTKSSSRHRNRKLSGYGTWFSKCLSKRPRGPRGCRSGAKSAWQRLIPSKEWSRERWKSVGQTESD